MKDLYNFIIKFFLISVTTFSGGIFITIIVYEIDAKEKFKNFTEVYCELVKKGELVDSPEFYTKFKIACED